MPESIAYGSLEWMPKSVWGPIKWKELHWRAKVPLPEDELKTWFAGFMASLPCEKCRTHFNEFVISNPPDFSDFFNWTVCAHNHVNQATGKPILTLEQAREANNEEPDPPEEP